MLLLLLIGAVSIAFAFFLLGQPQETPKWGIMIAASLAAFFISWTWAFLLYLRLRDRRNAIIISTTPKTSLSQLELEGTVYGMIPGRRYRVMKSFEDCYKNLFQKNDLLRFKQRHFLPYQDGHTIVFEERILYLQEEISREILENFSDYIAETTE